MKTLYMVHDNHTGGKKKMDADWVAIMASSPDEVKEKFHKLTGLDFDAVSCSCELCETGDFNMHEFDSATLQDFLDHAREDYWMQRIHRETTVLDGETGEIVPIILNPPPLDDVGQNYRK